VIEIDWLHSSEEYDLGEVISCLPLQQSAAAYTMQQALHQKWVVRVR
jgi:hypothetical protein